MSARFLISLLALAVAAPAGAAELPRLEFEKYTLDNGLEVILHEDHSTPIVAVNIWYHVGSKNEKVGRTGFAHLFEHMMFQGSEHQDAEYFGPLQSIGAQLNGSTSEDRTNYWEVVPSQHLERALLMEADRMGWLLPAMTEEKFANQQDVVRNERRQSEGQPYSAFWLNLNEQIYPKGHPYDHSVIGIHEDLAAATLDDVKEFFRTYYTPNNATLSIAGDFDPDQVKRWVAEYFGEISPGPPVSEVKAWVPEFTSEKRVHFEDRVQLPRAYYVWHSAPMYHPGDAELDLAAKILGQGRTSRLYKRLVHESKKAQEVSVWQSGGQLASQFTITVTPKPGVAIAEVEAMIDEELAAFAAKGPTAAELKRAQNDYEASFIKGIQRVGSWGGKADLLNRYNHYLGTPDYLEQDLARYLDATPASVREAFVRWIHDGRAVFEIHPAGEYAAAEPAAVDRATLPAGGAVPELPMPDLQKMAADNGLEMMLMRQPELPLVQARLVFRSGSAADPVGKSGLARVTGSMLEDGTKQRDKFAFAEALEELGTDFRVGVDEDYTTVTITTLKKHLDASMDLMADAILNAAFPAEEFELQKERRLVDIRREKDSPYATMSKVSRKVLYGGDHPYGTTGSGTPESMEALALEDVRAFARTHYTPQNAILIAVGDLTGTELEAAVARHLGGWAGMAPANAEIPEPVGRTERAVYLVDKPGDTQSTISIVHLGVKRNDPDWDRILVANRILGGFFSSRLNLNIREDKGYSYGVRSDWNRNVGRSYFYAGGRVQAEVTAEALTEFMRELNGIRGERPITGEELEFAKNSIVLGYPREFETIGEVAGALTEMAVFGLPEDELSAYPKRIEAVTVEEANAAGAQFFDPSRAAVIVLGDLSVIEEPVKALGLGPVYYLDRDGNPVRKGDGTTGEE